LSLSYCNSKKKKPHHVVYDEHTHENVCTNCGEIFVEKDEPSYNNSTRVAPHGIPSGTPPAIVGKGSIVQPPPLAIPGIEVIPPQVIVPITKLNADYTLTGVLASQISEGNRDAHGNKIVNPVDTNRMRFVDKYVVNSSYNADKSLRNAMWIIATLSDKLAISELIKERAAEIYRKAYKKNAVRGRSTKWLATAALFYACKEKNTFRNPNDFVLALDPTYVDEKDRSGRKDLFMNYKILTSVLDLPIPQVTSPLSELGRIAAIAGISEKSIRKAMKIYESLKDHDQTIFYGKSPAAISVCILYIATKYNNEQVKQDVITHSGQISTVTLRKRCDEYINILKEIDPNLPENVYAHRNNGTADRDEFTDADEFTPEYVPTQIKEEKYRAVHKKVQIGTVKV
jgi:transcription initiation factor TFIIB